MDTKADTGTSSACPYCCPYCGEIINPGEEHTCHVTGWVCTDPITYSEEWRTLPPTERLHTEIVTQPDRVADALERLADAVERIAATFEDKAE